MFACARKGVRAAKSKNLSRNGNGVKSPTVLSVDRKFVGSDSAKGTRGRLEADSDGFWSWEARACLSLAESGQLETLGLVSDRDKICAVLNNYRRVISCVWNMLKLDSGVVIGKGIDHDG